VEAFVGSLVAQSLLLVFFFAVRGPVLRVWIGYWFGTALGLVKWESKFQSLGMAMLIEF